MLRDGHPRTGVAPAHTLVFIIIIIIEIPPTYMYRCYDKCQDSLFKKGRTSYAQDLSSS